jgi:hypothetical protein
VHKAVQVLKAWFVLSFSLTSCVTTQIADPPITETPFSETPAAALSFVTSPEGLSGPPLAETNGIPGASPRVSNTFSVDLGAQTVKLKTSLVEKKEDLNGLNGILEKGLSRRYLDFLATSSSPGGGLQSEGEFSYSLPDSLKTQCGCGELPKMLRLSLKDRWAGFSFGADYRSIGEGFVFVTGEKIDHSRDEGQLWGEHSFGPFKLRGAIGQSWERLSELNQFRLTKTTTAAINFKRPAWSALWVSSFSLAGQGAEGSYDTTAFTQTFTGAYSPVNTLSVGSNLSFKQERNITSGLTTDTPAAGLTVVYKPSQNRFSFTGGTSYTRSISGLSSLGTVDFSAGVNWTLGKLRSMDDLLSFNLRYNRQLDFISPSASHEDFSGMLQLKLFGF